MLCGVRTTMDRQLSTERGNRDMSKRKITAAIIVAAIFVFICIAAGVILTSIDGGERFVGSVFIIINGLAMIAQLIIRMNDKNKRKTAISVIIMAVLIIVAVGIGIMFKNVYGYETAVGYYKGLLSSYVAAALVAAIFMVKVKKLKELLVCQTNSGLENIETDTIQE